MEDEMKRTLLIIGLKIAEVAVVAGVLWGSWILTGTFTMASDSRVVWTIVISVATLWGCWLIYLLIRALVVIAIPAWVAANKRLADKILGHK